MATLDVADPNWGAITLLAAGGTVSVTNGSTVITTLVHVQVPKDRLLFRGSLSKDNGSGTPVNIVVASESLNLVEALTVDGDTTTLRADPTDAAGVNYLAPFNGSPDAYPSADVKVGAWMGLRFTNATGSNCRWTANEDIVLLYPKGR